MAKKRHPKAGSGPKRRAPRGRSGGGGGPQRSGLMQGMVGGFRRAVGVERGAKRGPLGTVITIALVLAALALLFYRLR